MDHVKHKGCQFTL